MPDPVESARAAGLVYVTDSGPGVKRVKRGSGFVYIAATGTPIRDQDELSRIKSLAIPPAWTDVWICPNPRGHLQATGRDARGRKQHRYHPRWREVRDETKYGHIIDFAKGLPLIRRKTSQHLKLPGLPREKVLAAVVKLLEKTLIRVGNEEYAKSNKSFGLTTMRDGHVEISGATVTFDFRGKSGVEHTVDLEEPRLARIIKSCQDLPGEELFQYHNGDGRVCDVKSEDVNAYLREITGKDFTAKDFRTWAGTVLAAMALRELEEFNSNAQAKRNIVQAVESVARKLGNTKAVCRKCYVHPAVFDAYLDRSLAQSLKTAAERRIAHGLGKLRPDEAAVMGMLQQRLTRAAAGANPGSRRARARRAA